MFQAYTGSVLLYGLDISTFVDGRPSNLRNLILDSDSISFGLGLQVPSFMS